MRDSQRGSALIVTLGILTVLSMMAVVFASLMRVESRASMNVMDHKRCELVALSGLAHAVAKVYAESAPTDIGTWRNMFDPKLSLTEANPGKDPAVYNGQYKITFIDTGARININAAGNTAGGGGAQAANEGWSVRELSLTQVFVEAGVAGSAATYAQYLITDNDYGRQRGASPDQTDATLTSDGIDNDGNGVIDDASDTTCAYLANPLQPSGSETPFTVDSEFDIYLGAPHNESSTVIKCWYDTGIGTAAADWELVRPYLTCFSVDAPYATQGGLGADDQVNINTASGSEISQALQDGGLGGDDADQLAAAIVDYRDSGDSLTTVNGKKGVEEQPFISEVFYGIYDGVDRAVELYNPFGSAQTVTNWQIDGVTFSGTVPAGGYLVITEFNVNGGEAEDTPTITGGSGTVGVTGMSFTNASGTVILKDGSGNVRDVSTNCGAITAPAAPAQTFSREREDPQDDATWANVSGLTAYKDANGTTNRYWHSLGSANSNYSSHYTLTIKNNKFSTVGEICEVLLLDHTDTDIQVFTDDVASGDPGWFDVGANSDVFNYLTVTEGRDANSHQIPGRININTASAVVLSALPGGTTSYTNAASTTKTLAEWIVDYRTGVGTFAHVGQLYAMLTNANYCNLSATDAKAPFKKISNLCTVRSDVFGVKVDAQLLLDGGGTLAKCKLVAIIDRTVHDNPRVVAKGWVSPDF